MAQLINGQVVFDPTDLTPYYRTLGDFFAVVADLAESRLADPGFYFDYPPDDEYPAEWTSAIEVAAGQVADEPQWRDRLLALGIESGSGQAALWEYQDYLAELGCIADSAYELAEKEQKPEQESDYEIGD